MLKLNLPRKFNAAEYFVDRNVSAGRGGKTAILFEDQKVTYDNLMENVNRTANGLRQLGVGMESRVMLLRAFSTTYVATWLATSAAFWLASSPRL